MLGIELFEEHTLPVGEAAQALSRVRNPPRSNTRRSLGEQLLAAVSRHRFVCVVGVLGIGAVPAGRHPVVGTRHQRHLRLPVRVALRRQILAHVG